MSSTIFGGSKRQFDGIVLQAPIDCENHSQINHQTLTTIADSANDATAAEWISGCINVSGGGADTWTLPTGAVLSAVIPQCQAGTRFDCMVINNSGGSLTFAQGASGSVLSSPGTLVGITAKCMMFHFVFTTSTAYSCLMIADNA